ILHITSAARAAREDGAQAGQTVLAKPALHLLAEVKVQRRVARSEVQVHGLSPLVAADEARQGRHARAGADEQYRAARAIEHETGVRTNEGLDGLAGSQPVQLGGADAAGNLAH